MAVLDDVARAYRAIHRSEPDRFEVDQAAARIEAGALTLDGYIDSQIARAETTTIPAFVFVARFGGNAPTSDYLDTVAAFAKAQYDYYVAIGSASPQLGPYEALGMAFSKTMEFNAKYGLSALADDNNFISLAYLEVFGRYVSGGAYANLKGQLDYFETLYKSAGFSASDATMQARGAVFGQLIGYQQTLPEERALVVTDEQARIFLKLAAHGASSIYGEPLENLPVAGRDIVGSSYDQDQYGWVNTIAPASSAAALRTTIYDDHVVVGVINASIGSRGLTGIDGGAGNDLIEVGGASGGSFIRGGKGNDAITVGKLGEIGSPTIDAGPGDDRIEVGLAKGTIAGGEGRDTLIVSGAAPELGISGVENASFTPAADTLMIAISNERYPTLFDLGGGKDRVYVEASFANLIVENGLIANVAAFAGFQKGAASLSIGGDVKVVIGPDVAAAASLEAAVAQIAQATASGGASAFEYAGSTNIFKQNGTAAAESGDGLIKIIGVTGITHSSDANSFY